MISVNDIWIRINDDIGSLSLLIYMIEYDYFPVFDDDSMSIHDGYMRFYLLYFDQYYSYNINRIYFWESGWLSILYILDWFLWRLYYSIINDWELFMISFFIVYDILFFEFYQSFIFFFSYLIFEASWRIFFFILYIIWFEFLIFVRNMIFFYISSISPGTPILTHPMIISMIVEVLYYPYLWYIFFYWIYLIVNQNSFLYILIYSFNIFYED
jgi:hypothetical protein